MASIGGTSCEHIKGTATGAKESLMTWRREGLNGVAAKKMGDEAGIFVFLLVKRDSDANVETWQTAIEAKSATIVDIIDDDAITHSNCMIETVSEMIKFDLLEPPSTKIKHAAMTVTGFIIA